MEKESVKKFDLEAAFKALDEIEIPAIEKGSGRSKANRVDLKERFSHKPATETLVEDYYDVSSNEDLEEAKEEREGEVAQAKLARIEKIVDLDAETADDLLPSYVGKVIMQCPQCMTLFYKNPEDIEHSEENPDVVNINEICQHCGNSSGYTLIGKVDSVAADEADNYSDELPVEENELDLDFDEIPEEEPAEEANDLDLDLDLEEIPEEEPEEEKNESLNLSKEAPSDFETEHKSENLTLNEEATDESLNTSEAQKEAEEGSELKTENESENLTLNEEVDKDLDAKLKAHNDYIAYLQQMIKQEEEALKKTDNEEVKAAIQRRLDAFTQDLHDALPDVLKDEPEANEVATEEPVEEISEEPVEEALTESAKVRVADVEYNDDDGYDQHVIVYAGDLNEDELIDAMYEAGYMYCCVNDIFEKEIDGNHKVLDVIEILDEGLKEEAEDEPTELDKARIHKIDWNPECKLVLADNEEKVVFAGTKEECEKVIKKNKDKEKVKAHGGLKILCPEVKESLTEAVKKYIIRIDFGDSKVEETFDTEEAAINYLQDQYDNWFADDENVAEEIIFPLLTNAKDHNWIETDDAIIIESLNNSKEAVSEYESENGSENLTLNEGLEEDKKNNDATAKVDAIINNWGSANAASEKNTPINQEIAPADKQDEEVTNIVSHWDENLDEDINSEIDSIIASWGNVHEDLIEEGDLDKLLDSKEFQTPVSEKEIAAIRDEVAKEESLEECNKATLKEEPEDQEVLNIVNDWKEPEEEKPVEEGIAPNIDMGGLNINIDAAGQHNAVGLGASEPKVEEVQNEGILSGVAGLANGLSKGIEDIPVVGPILSSDETPKEGEPLKEEDEEPAAEEESPVEEPIEDEEEPIVENQPIETTVEEVKEIATEVAEKVSEPVEDEEAAEEQKEEIKEVVDEVVEEKLGEEKSEEEIPAEEESEEEFDFDDLQEESFNIHVKDYLTDVYENVKDFAATSCELKEGKLFVEGKISFKSGKEKLTMFEFLPQYGEGKLFFEGYNKDLTEDKAFVLNCTLTEAKEIITESFGYKYNINETLVEGLK